MAFRHVLSGRNDHIFQRLAADEAVDIAIPAEALIAGSIDEVAAQFHALGELGYTDVIVRHLTNDQQKVLGSLERLEKVRAALG